MSENISEQSEGITTSITRLTCKPLAILSETISTQEMNMARGGGDDDDDDPIDWNTGSIFKAIVNAIFGPPPGEKEPKKDLVTDGPQIPINSPPEPVDPFAVLLDDPDSDDPDDPYSESDPFKRIAEADSLSHAESGIWEGGDSGEEDDENCEYCDDENCDGDCANNDDDDELDNEFATAEPDNTRVGN